MSRTSQRKGRAGELELVKILRDNGFDVRPGEAVSYGEEPDIVGLDGIHCEVKRCEALRLSEWAEQAERDSKRFGDGFPTIFHRRSREPWRVTMLLTDWLELYSRGTGDKQAR